MSNKWTEVFTTEDALEAEILKQGLEESDIAAVVMNKQDSPHKMFGVITVLVHPDDTERAKQYLLENDIK
jgi:hypothetical protein